MAKRLGADKQPSYGVIAQEVAEIIPNAIGAEAGYLTVNYQELY